MNIETLISAAGSGAAIGIVGWYGWLLSQVYTKLVRSEQIASRIVLANLLYLPAIALSLASVWAFLDMVWSRPEMSSGMADAVIGISAIFCFAAGVYGVRRAPNAQE